MQRQVINEVFENCSELTDDPFWKNKLQMAARGKFPPGFFYRDGFLNYKKRKKQTSVHIPGEPIQAINVFVSFMQGFGFYSNLDLEYYGEQSMLTEDCEAAPPPEAWSKVPKKLRTSYITSYVKKRMELLEKGFRDDIDDVTFSIDIEGDSRDPLEQYRCEPLKNKALLESCALSLERTIHLGIGLKIFNKDNIVLYKYSIKHIPWLIYNEDTHTFSISSEVIQRTYEEKAGLNTPSGREHEGLQFHGSSTNRTIYHWKRMTKDYNKIYALSQSATKKKASQHIDCGSVATSLEDCDITLEIEEE